MICGTGMGGYRDGFGGGGGGHLTTRDRYRDMDLHNLHRGGSSNQLVCALGPSGGRSVSSGRFGMGGGRHGHGHAENVFANCDCDHCEDVNDGYSRHEGVSGHYRDGLEGMMGGRRHGRGSHGGRSFGGGCGHGTGY